METIRTTIVLLVVALAFAGCAQSPEAERVQPTLTQLEPVEQPTEQPTEVTNPYGLDDQTIDTLFLANVRDLAPVMVGVPDADLFSAADAICDAFDSGATFDAIALTALGSGFPPETGGVLIGSSVAAYCDEYLGLLG